MKDTPWAELPSVLKKAGMAAGGTPPPPPPSPAPSDASDTEGSSVKIDTETGPVYLKAQRVKKAGRKAPVYICSGCDAEYGSVNGCKAHILREHSGRPLVCDVCDWTTYNADSLMKHTRDAHPDR